MQREKRITTARWRNSCLLAIAALVTTACAASITPLQPRGPTPESVPSQPIARADATDVLYFEVNPLMVPVEGIAPSRIPDSFNEPRDGGRIHRATDILAPMGTPVLAAESGTVIRMSHNSLGGTTIYMTDDSGRFVFYYAHLERYAAGLADQAHVSQGDVIAYVGMTGNAPMPHLHFQAMRRDVNRHDYWNGAAVDVQPFFTLTGKARTGDEEQTTGGSPR